MHKICRMVGRNSLPAVARGNPSPGPGKTKRLEVCLPWNPRRIVFVSDRYGQSRSDVGLKRRRRSNQRSRNRCSKLPAEPPAWRSTIDGLPTTRLRLFCEVSVSSGSSRHDLPSCGHVCANLMCCADHVRRQAGCPSKSDTSPPFYDSGIF